MKLITIIPDELFNIFKKHGIMAFDYLNEYDRDQTAIAIAHAVPYNPSGDCISRESVKAKMFDIPKPKEGATFWDGVDTVGDLIDNAPPVNTNVVADDVIKAHENIGYEQGFNDGYAKCVTDNERPQGDCISREALRKEVTEKVNFTTVDGHIAYDKMLKLIDNAPTVDIKDQIAGAYNEGYMCGNKEAEKARPQGEWINHRNDYGHNIADCSLCGKTMQWHDEDGDGIPRYCWYCGADMWKGDAE